MFQRIAQAAQATATATLGHIAAIKNRKLLLGLVYLGAIFSLAETIILVRPAMGLSGLAALATGLGAGICGIVYGIAKEPPVPPSPDV